MPDFATSTVFTTFRSGRLMRNKRLPEHLCRDIATFLGRLAQMHAAFKAVVKFLSSPAGVDLSFYYNSPPPKSLAARSASAGLRAALPGGVATPISPASPSLGTA